MQPQDTDFVIKHIIPIKMNRNFQSHDLTTEQNIINLKYNTHKPSTIRYIHFKH